MLDRIKITLQYFLPKFWLTRLAGWAAEYHGGWLTFAVITLFIRTYKINMQEAKQSNVSFYPTFNSFFSRSLREDARPIDLNPSVLVIPADGIVSQFGHIEDERIFQAKGHFYSLEALLVGNDEMINNFRNGTFITTYLTLQDYHRVHMPCNGVLREMIYVPGNLFSVNPFLVENIPNIFARNERLICLFDTNFGPIAQILVGSTIVGSIETVWLGKVTPPRKGIIKKWRYPESNHSNSIVLLKGQEMGQFKLGSTVINLFSKGRILLDDSICPQYVMRIGKKLANGIL